MPKRKKTSALIARVRDEIRSDLYDVDADVAQLGNDIRRIEELRANAAAAIAAIEEECRRASAPFTASATERAKRIYDHAKTKSPPRFGHLKTVRVGTGSAWWALSPPAVKLQEPDDVLAWLLQRKRDEFIRRPDPQINRQAMLDDPEEAKKVPGVSIAQAEKVAVRSGNSHARVEATLGKNGRPGKWKIVWPKDEAAAD